MHFPKKNIGKYAGFAFVGIAFAMFIAFLVVVRSQYNPNIIFEQLQQQKLIIPLKEFKTTFKYCKNLNGPQDCSIIGKPYQTLAFPDTQHLSKLIASLDGEVKPNVAEMLYAFSEKQRLWIKDRKNSLKVYIPRNVQNATWLEYGKKRASSRSYGTDASFTISKDLKDSVDKIKITMEFQDLPWFGPADTPIVLGTSSGIVHYSRMFLSQIMTANIGRALKFSMFLLVVLVALIIDHALPMRMLAAYSFFRFMRDFIEIPIDFSIEPLYFLNHTVFSYISNAGSFVFLCGFCYSLYPFKRIRRKQSALFICGSGFAIALLYQFNAQIAGGIDLDAARFVPTLVDILGCLTGAVICLLGTRRYFRQDALKSENHSFLQLSSLTLRSVLLLSGLVVHFYANTEILFDRQTDYYVDFLSLGQHYLFFTLVLTGLFEIGSTSKAMKIFSQKIVEQANIERDMEMGRQVQMEMLPLRRKSTPSWQYRTFYYPAAHLAGDWFDIKEVKFPEGKNYIFACLADVTGHGISAAMMTSTISSQWGQYISKLEELGASSIEGNEQAAVHQCVEFIHRGLISIRSNLGASAAVLLIDPDTQIIHYCTPGHPGIITTNPSGKMEYLTTKGPRLGGPTFFCEVNSKKLLSQQTIYFFTDGLVPPKTIVAKWLGQLKRETRKNKIHLSRQLINAIRLNRREFRKNRNIEDDMTVIAIHLSGKAEATDVTSDINLNPASDAAG